MPSLPGAHSDKAGSHVCCLSAGGGLGQEGPVRGERAEPEPDSGRGQGEGTRQAGEQEGPADGLEQEAGDFQQLLSPAATPPLPRPPLPSPPDVPAGRELPAPGVALRPALHGLLLQGRF